MPRKAKRATQAAKVLRTARQKRKSQRSFQGFLQHSLWRIVTVEGKRARTPKESGESKESTKLSTTSGKNSKCFRKIPTSRNLKVHKKYFVVQKQLELLNMY